MTGPVILSKMGLQYCFVGAGAVNFQGLLIPGCKNSVNVYNMHGTFTQMKTLHNNENLNLKSFNKILTLGDFYLRWTRLYPR